MTQIIENFCEEVRNKLLTERTQHAYSELINAWMEELKTGESPALSRNGKRRKLKTASQVRALISGLIGYVTNCSRGNGTDTLG